MMAMNPPVIPFKAFAQYAPATKLKCTGKFCKISLIKDEKTEGWLCTIDPESNNLVLVNPEAKSLGTVVFAHAILDIQLFDKECPLDLSSDDFAIIFKEAQNYVNTKS